MKTNGPNTHIKLSRRQLLSLMTWGGLGLAATVYSRLSSQKLVELSKNENSYRGHLVREPLDLTQIASISEVDHLIVGSGISGLSTAYFLEKNKKQNYKILEADSKIGGNSASGGNAISQFPLGAHYLPIIRNDDLELATFLKEIGVITGEDKGLPIYNEEYLCQAPNERLFIKGRWQESIIPTYAASKAELSEIKDFLAYVESLRNLKGRDGKYIFAIPVDHSSQDAEWLKLDQISFKDFLNSREWKGEYISWYADYCCRDDFGLDADHTSAWAGLHYFCSRSGKAANAEVQSVLTWPQGNGFLVEKLLEKISQKVQTSSTVRQVSKKNKIFEVYYSDADLKTHLIRCNKIVYAIPKAVVQRVQPELKFSSHAESHPWIVANITLPKAVLEEKVNLSWDNVRFGSTSLGYVNACHQLLQQEEDNVNISFYHAFSSGDSLELRRTLSKMSEADLRRLIFDELKKMHPHIETYAIATEVKIWGHGMVAPKVNYIWDQRLKLKAQEPEDIYFAHTERAGVSIFEEAFHQGRRAALKLLGSV